MKPVHARRISHVGPLLLVISIYYRYRAHHIVVQDARIRIIPRFGRTDADNTGCKRKPVFTHRKCSYFEPIFYNVPYQLGQNLLKTLVM